MFTYNAARHTIEAEGGLTVARLTAQATAELAYRIQDALNDKSDGQMGRVERVRKSLTRLTQSAGQQVQSDFQF
jgi:hypothetical protein